MSTDDAVQVAVDVLVIGGGMAGLTVGALAAGRGLSVGLVEKAPDIGGSARLSSGGLAKVASAEIYASANPSGDRALGRMLAEGYDEVIQWISDLGVAVGAPSDVEDVLGFSCSARGIDIIRYLALARVEIEHAGGWVVTNTKVLHLDSTSDGVVIGATVSDRDGISVIRSGATVIATGGFQGSPELRERYLGANGRNMLLRANPFSEGDGLRLVASVGGATTERMDRFYGHTVPSPLSISFEAKDFSRFAMPFLSQRCLLLDRLGRRIVDESSGYDVCAQAVLKQHDARALLVGDEQLRSEDLAGSSVNRALGVELVDRLAQARASGARVFSGGNAAELGKVVAGWGFDGAEFAITTYNSAVSGDAEMQPSRRRHRRRLEPPFFAMEVQPAITFTYGGVRVDDRMNVVRTDNSPIPNLYAVGADVGGVFHEHYASGLSLASISAFRAVRSIEDRLSSGLQRRAEP